MKRILIIVPLIVFANTLFAYTTVDFYGHRVLIRNHNFSSLKLNKVDVNTLDRFNAAMDRNMILRLTREIDSLKDAFNLDDVGCVQLITKISRSVYADNNRSQFIRWTLLKEQHFQAVLAYNNNDISTFGVLGFSPSNAVYVMLGGEKFTNLDFKDYRLMGKRKIYGRIFDGRAIYLNASKKPRLFEKKRSRKLTFYYDNKKIEITAKGNESLIEYIRDLPTMDFDHIYMDFGVSDDLRNTLFRELRFHMNGMSQKEKLSFLLKFTQQTFNYASDQDRLGREKYNFPEETIFETYSDCDDRVILLACLYKELIGLNSVVLLFSEQDHVSLAVHVPGTTVGGSFKYDGKPYYVCEPTGINYNFGRSAYPLSTISKVYKLY